MFTYTLAQPRRPIAQAFQATLIHASLIAGAVWATKAAPVITHPKPPIDITLSPVPTRVRVRCDCSVPSMPQTGLSTVPPIPVIVLSHDPATPTVDPRSLIPDDHGSLTGPVASDTISATSVFDEAVVDELPTLLVAGQLRYPAVQREAGIEGTVTLSYVIDAEGRVEQDGMEVVSATLPAFVAAAEEAVLTSRFHPAMKRHTPVRVRARQTVTFRR